MKGVAWDVTYILGKVDVMGGDIRHEHVAGQGKARGNQILLATQADKIK